MREKFTEEEWRVIRILPLVTFVFAAGSEGKEVDEGEVAAFASELRDPLKRQDPLHRAILADIEPDLRALSHESVDLSQIVERMALGEAILKSLLTAEDYQRFAGSIGAEAYAWLGVLPE